MKFQSLLRESIRKLPTIGEPHYIKGVLALQNFSKRYPHWDDSTLQMIFDRVKWETYPAVQNLFYPMVQHTGEPYSPIAAKKLIGRGLFPIAYLCGYHWYQLEGLQKVIEKYKERAIHESGYLGHGWSVWCSFYEIIAQLETEEDQLLALERFVEFAAKKFPGYPTSNSKWRPPLQEDPGPQDFSEIFNRTIEKPGFFGHHLLTLGYLHRHRNLLTETEWNIGLYQVERMTRTTYVDKEDNVCVPFLNVEMKIDDQILEQTIKDVLLYGIRDLHSLTLTDICYDLWNIANERQKKHLIQYLRTMIVEN